MTGYNAVTIGLGFPAGDRRRGSLGDPVRLSQMTVPTADKIVPMAMSMHNIRTEDDVWARAGERAAKDGTNLSAMIRQWLADYAAGGDANAGRAKVRLSAAERRAIAKTLEGLDIGGIVVDAINGER